MLFSTGKHATQHKTFLFILMSALFLTILVPSDRVCADIRIPPSDENFIYMGRWDRTNPQTAATIYSGASIRFAFTGGSCTLHFDATPYPVNLHPILLYRLDDGAWREWTVDSQLTIHTTQPFSSHSVEIVTRSYIVSQQRWYPPRAAIVIFTGITLPSGSQILPGRRPTGPRIEVLADSITEGIAVYVNDGSQNVAQVSDATLSYAYLAARHFDADLRFSALSGQGIMTAGNGGVPESRNTFAYVYSGVENDSWQAGLVIVNYGTNDGNTSEKTMTAYCAFYLDLIRSHYPHAEILCLRPFNGTQANAIEAAVTNRHAAGDRAVHYVDTTGWLDPANTTDGRHPTPAGHALLADKLIQLIQPFVSSTRIPDFMLY